MVDRSTSLARKGRAKFGSMVDDLARECEDFSKTNEVHDFLRRKHAYLSWADLDSLTEAVYRTQSGLRF